MNRKKLINLQLFADGAPSADGNGGEGNVGTNNTNTAENAVIQNAGVNGNEESFENLISGKYKEDFENELSKRLSEKENSIAELKEKLGKHNTLFDALSVKYGKKSSDVDGILEAVSKDNTYFEAAAAREGLTVEQFKQLREFEKMQESRKKFEQEERARTQAENDLRKWFKQSETLKAKYPDIDFQTEISNEQFLDLLKNNIDFETAYKVIHSDEIINGAIKVASETAEKNAVIKMQQKANRPLENGVNAGAGALVNTTVSKLTRKERADLARRAARGEKIKL